MHLSFPLSSLSARGCPRAWLAALAASATAQIEPNQVGVSRFQGGGGSAPLGGLSVFDLANPGSGVEITGLSPDLTGSTSGSGNVEGSASVLVDRRTGFLVVGEHALPGADTEIHVLYLTGTTVAQDDAYKLGSAPTGGGWVDQMAWLGDDVVFSVRGRALTTGVMTGHLVGVLRPQVGPPGSPGTVTPVPMNPLPVGSVNALAVDEASGTAYFAMFQGGGVPNEIYSVPVPGDGVTPATPTLVATVANGVLNLGMDGEGQLLVGAIGALLRVDVTQSPATVTTLQPIADVNALSVENTSGDVVIAVSGTGTIYTWQPGPSFVTLGNVAGGASGIAIRQSLIPYGPATPGQNSYDWVLAPNAGGAPTVGKDRKSVV